MSAGTFGEIYFTKLPCSLSDKEHFVVGTQIGRLVIPRITFCWHRANRWPSGLGNVRKRVKVRAAGFRCPHCHSTVLQHPMIVMNGTIYLCKCTLAGLDNRFGFRQPGPKGWSQIQAIYVKAELQAGQFPAAPGTLWGWN
jgi:hypothetical protein